MAVAQGSRLTDTVAQGQRKIDVSKSILNLDPSATPYTVILKKTQSGGNRQSAVNPEFKWAEDQREMRWDAVNEALGYEDVGVTTITVNNGTRFYPGALVKVPSTGETMFVSSVSGNDLTVVRGYSGTTATALVDTDPLLTMGYAADENSRAPAVRSENPVFVTNYTQIFKKTIGASGTWRSSDNETTPHDWDQQKMKAHVEHMIDIETAALFGEPSEVAGTDGPNRTTGGLWHYMTYNGLAVGGALTEADFDAWLSESIFKDGSMEKILLASPFLISVLMQFSKAKLNTTVAESKYGVNYTDYVTPNGTLSIVKHKLLEGDVYGKSGVVVDMKKGDLKYRYLSGGVGGSRDTHVVQDVQETDRDGKIDNIITECGFQIGLPQTGGIISGVTGAG